MGYRNRPDRRRAPFAEAFASQGQITYTMNCIDGIHFTAYFSEPVTWDGNLAAFKWHNQDDDVDVIADSAVLNNGNTELIFHMIGPPIGVIVAAATQPLTSIRGYTGNIITGTPLFFAV